MADRAAFFLTQGAGAAMCLRRRDKQPSREARQYFSVIPGSLISKADSGEDFCTPHLRHRQPLPVKLHKLFLGGDFHPAVKRAILALSRHWSA